MATKFTSQCDHGGLHVGNPNYATRAVGGIQSAKGWTGIRLKCFRNPIFIRFVSRISYHIIVSYTVYRIILYTYPIVFFI